MLFAFTCVRLPETAAVENISKNFVKHLVYFGKIL